jgi:uncharacterized membrane protein
MTLLIAGLAIWSLVHLYPAVAGASRDALVSRLGRNGYRGAFSLAIVAGLALIFIGWSRAVPVFLYRPPLPGGPVTAALMLIAFALFVAARVPSNIQRLLRHPQLTGVLLWSVAHLLANGDSRSVVLFGTFALWSIVEMTLLSRRDGAWRRPPKAPLARDAAVLAVAAVAFAIILFTHGKLFGVAAWGRLG